MLYTRDLGEKGVQAGSFVVRNSRFALDFLQQIYGMWIRLRPDVWFSDRYAVMKWLELNKGTRNARKVAIVCVYYYYI